MKVTHSVQGSPSVKGTWLPKPGPQVKVILLWTAIVVTWALLAFFAFFTGICIGWITLVAIVMHSGPSAEAYIIGPIMLALVGALTWLAGRAAGSLRRAGLFAGAIVAAVLVGFAIWAPSHPENAIFLARQVAWSESGVKDYLLFPERAIANSAPNFYFKQAVVPGSFPTVEYTSDGKPMQAPFEEFLESTNTTSFIVIKDDAILYEGYFNGYQRDSIVTSFSMAKSITSALVGIAIEEGFIGGVNDPVIQYVPELKGRGLDDLTIRHLLTMSTGISYVSDDELPGIPEIFQFTDDGLSYSHPNLRRIALGLKPGKTPVGAEFNYNNYHLQVLGLILERTTGMTPSAYLQEKIWKPLGMEYPASWSLDSEEDAFELMTAGVNGRAIDFARFGRLFLNKGNWEGNQVIPESWVIESTSPDPNDTRPWHSDTDWNKAGGYYKYLWWGVNRPDGGYDYVARGHNGQRIYVAPQENMVIVRFGYDEGGVDSWEYFFMDIIDQVGRSAPQALLKATPEEMGFDSAILAADLPGIQQHDIPIHSLMFIGRDKVFLDAYFHPYDGSIYHDLASVTKSVTTTLVGIAAGQGKLDLDQPVISFFPDRTFANMDTRKESMNVRDLASMRSGLECGNNNDEPTLQKMRATQDWVQYALDQPMNSKPGTKFSYCGMSMHLLSAIITQTTGMPALEFAKENLFGPLGIQEFHWPADPQGNNRGWGDLSLHPSDMAKIGVLFQHEGRWGDRQIVPAEWVSEATKPYATITGRFENYGYGWWISPEGEEPAYFLAAGNGGQRIQVFPGKDLVIVTTGGGFEFDQVIPYFIKALADGPLPPNLAGQAQLEQTLQTFVKAPAPKPVPPMPEIASSISGKTFQLRSCGIIRAVRLDLEDSAEAVFTLDLVNEQEPRVSTVGLDGIPRPSRVGKPILARGEWWDGNRFAIEYDEGPGKTYLKIIMNFKSNNSLILDIAGMGSCEGVVE